MGFHKVSGQLTLFTSDEIVYTWFAGILLWCIIWGFVTRAIVKGKGYENSGSWFLCGFFLGIIGVIVAACKPAVNVPQSYAPVQPQTSSADELFKYKKLLEQGAITQEEYDVKKKQLLNDI